MPSGGHLREIALVFLKLGTMGFGGPAAHIAMMEDEVVRRRQWLSRERFLDYVGATNLIPGPNSTELAIHLGHVRGGWPGLLVAGCCFILPATIIVTALAWGYVRFGTLPLAQAFLYGIKPVLIAIVLQALWRLGRTAVKGSFLALLGVAAAVATALGANEFLVLLAAALLGTLNAGIRREAAAGLVFLAPAMPAPDTWPIFITFARIGSVLFGSGYVLLAFLRSELVERLGWLTEQQLLDAIAVGQATPGPVFTTATFVGYVVHGPAGAAAATLGIFAPAFLFVAASGWLIPRIRKSRLAGAILDAINVASLALMAVVTWALGRAALVDWASIVIALASALALFRWRLNATWLVLAGAVIGILVSAL